ncbi:hypothetical protein MTBBW1_1540012 [Desulfamplus magnetovallimortis]|uniref:Macrodomain Ori protein n=1 Tax=Desulfamplus magnetovallimortis TaxID=1246637 RepID=A0A1W1H8M2_9BACT|nr:DUF413 domain-containing protein [Desulfamplus magnetovallimortis]SLM28786.1 hypothetical protein MTBBW1_1540012 [Desulfamplus magnetovallimortis]
MFDKDSCFVSEVQGEYLKTPFDIGNRFPIFNPHFTDEEIEILTRYGNWMEAIDNNTIPPLTKKQETFLYSIYKGASLTNSIYEKTWIKFKYYEKKNIFDNAGWNYEGINKFTKTMYDLEGFDMKGFDKTKIHKSTKTRFDKDGYNFDGYDRKGFNRNGLNRCGKRIYNENQRTCPRCNGTGQHNNCIWCDGSGWIRVN